MPPAEPIEREETRTRFFDYAPRLLAFLAFLGGAAALVSASIPDLRPAFFHTFLTGREGIPLALGGLALMVLSLGLVRKLKPAWALTVIACAHGFVATLILKPRPVEALMYGAILGLALISRRSFYRHSSLASLRFTWGWFFAACLVIALAGFSALLWASHQQGFVEASFLELVTDPELGQAGRPIAFALLVFAFGALFVAIASPARGRPALPASGDYQHLLHLLEMSDLPHPDNILAFSGDKTLLFGPERKAAIAFAKAGNLYIAMGAPIGPKSHWKAALKAFQNEADKTAMRTAIYAAPPDLLPDLLDLGYKIEKIGENAILDLPDFSLSGRKREVIRRGRRKIAERAGGTFQIAYPPHSDALLAELRPVSTAWLEANGGQEKAFSLGKFDRPLIDHCPLGIVALKGKTVAFGSLLTTPDKSWAGIDLMRYDPDAAVTNTMDFLLVELILWAKENDYQRFDLAMAPLSGLVEADYAPLFARIGHFIFERGERLYNFKGLRRFKQKFNPRWAPRYIAAENKWTLPLALAHAARLTSKAPPQEEADQARPSKEL